MKSLNLISLAIFVTTASSPMNKNNSRSNRMLKEGVTIEICKGFPFCEIEEESEKKRKL